MSKKVYRLIVGVSGGIAAVAVAVVEAGISEICSFFVKEE